MSNSLFAQEYTVKYINSSIEIDGIESEDVWKKANVGTDFWQWRPADTVQAVKQTEFKAVFDDDNLYFLVKSFTKEKKFTVYSLKRDFNTASADYYNVDVCVESVCSYSRRIAKFEGLWCVSTI